MSYKTRMNIQNPSMTVKLEQARSLSTALSCNGVEGKRRKLIVAKTNETNILQQANAATTDGSVVFKILNQPETQHRARYQTEGSRGAIKDRSGIGYPTVKLDGYRRPTKIQIFIGNDNGKVQPHMFYQVCKVTGKNSNPCDERKIDGTDIIEISSEPHNDMTIICDCVGILKERFADVEARFPKQKTWKNSKKKSTKCRLVFRAVVENLSGQTETLQVVSDVINCTQLPGTPEILKMSTSSSFIDGGGELWIIGKNFLKDTKVVFSHSIVGKKEPLWTKFIDPQQEYFHQAHLITRIPPFYDPNTSEDVEVNVLVKCGDKFSDPVMFTYKGKPIQFTFTPPVTDSHDVNLPRGVAAPAIAINQQYAETGSVSVIKTNDKHFQSECVPQPRPTILEPLHSHKSKKTKMEFVGKKIRRTRSVPRPNLIDEDTMFVSDQSNQNIPLPNFQQSPGSPWKGISKSLGCPTNLKLVQSQFSPLQCKLRESLNVYKTDLSELVIGNPKRSRSHDEESNSCNFNKDSLLDDNSFCSTKADYSSSLTTDFSNVFNFKRNQLCETGTTLSFSKATYPNPADYKHSGPASRISPVPAPWKTEPVYEITPDTSPLVCADEKKEEENKDVPNVSYQATSDDKATISISLPTSILKDQKHFQNVIDTINNTLLKQNTTSDDESEKVAKGGKESPDLYENNIGRWAHEAASVQSDQWNKTQTSPNMYQSEARDIERNISPTQQITSMPVSVLSKTRKRTFTGESAEETDFESNFGTTNIICTSKAPSEAGSLSPKLSYFARNGSATNETSHVTANIDQSVYQISENADYSPELLTTENEQVNNPAFTDKSYNCSSSVKWQQKEETTAQEKKWNADFNALLQTVIEEEKDSNLSKVDWDSKLPVKDKGTPEWKPKSSQNALTKPGSNNLMDWTTNTEAVSIPVNFQEDSSSTIPSYLVEPVSASEVRDALDIIETFQTDVGTTAQTHNAYSTSIKYTGKNVIFETREAEGKKKKEHEKQSTAQGSNMQHTVITPMPKTSEMVQEDISSTQFNLPDPLGTSVVFLNDKSPENRDRASTSTLEQYANKSTTDTELNQPEVQLFGQTLLAIQGDPLLSESSSVIEVQKDIENASFEIPEKEDVFKQSTPIPKDQEWIISGTQNNEWTFTSGS